MTYVALLMIGLLAGCASGLFGVGGGVIIVPLLVYLLGFSQHLAIGTSLAVMLPPIGLAAVLEYHRHGYVDFRAAILIALALIVGAWLSAIYAQRITGPTLRMAFGAFLVLVGCYTTYTSWRALP